MWCSMVYLLKFYFIYFIFMFAFYFPYSIVYGIHVMNEILYDYL